MSPVKTSTQRELVELLPRLRRFARALTRHPADADDLVQLALERALMNMNQPKPDSRMDSWMFRIIRNAWIDETRARGRWNTVLAPEEAGQNVGDASAADGVNLLSMQQAMATLPEEQRSAVALVLIEGLSYKQAAATLEVPVGTLTSRLARGREALQALLGSDAGGKQ
ncbi:MAG: sigma-70 family RNA polymerase sigma factor [Gammaproteobacteria bacterium]